MNVLTTCRNLLNIKVKGQGHILFVCMLRRLPRAVLSLEQGFTVL